MLRVYDSRSNSEPIEALRKYGFYLERSWQYGDRGGDVLAERRFALSERTKAAMTPARSSSASSAPEEGFSSSTEYKDAYHYTALGRTKEARVPWGFGPILSRKKGIGEHIFDEINGHILNHVSLLQIRYQREMAEQGLLDETHIRSHSFSSDEEYENYLKAVENSNHHVLSCFRYHASNPSEFHVAAHVDKGLLTIVENPNSLEVCYKGRWYPLGPQPDGVIAVLAGYSLERATGGLFEASLHRVRNEGNRYSRVTKIRLDPDFVLHPRAIIASVDEELLDMLPDPPRCLSVNDMMVRFHSIHTSVNAAQASIVRGLRIADPSKNESHRSLGTFSILPDDLLQNFLRNWIDDLETVFRLSATCKLLRSILGSEEYLVPLADRSVSFSWDWALDAIDPRSIVPLGVTANRWLGFISKELGKRYKYTLTIRLRDNSNDEEIQFKMKHSTLLGKVFKAYAARKGISVATCRFLLDGNRLEYDKRAYNLQLENGDLIDVVMEQAGD